ERRLGDREREMVDAARFLLVDLAFARAAILVREHGDQPAVAGIEVEVALRLVVEVRLLEHERHAQQALPEVDRGLTPGPDERDVVDALSLDLPHQRSMSLDLYSLRCKVPNGTRSTCVCTTSTA